MNLGSTSIYVLDADTESSSQFTQIFYIKTQTFFKGEEQMVRGLKGWEEELSTNSRINTANMITQDWREWNERIAKDIELSMKPEFPDQKKWLLTLVKLLREA
jgi:hypothetical protein